jgi:glycosyltransferase involved in cell wall biosynthesis
MKLLFWCDPFWPAVGGIPVIAAQFAASLVQRGYELHVVTDEAPGDVAAPPGLEVTVHRYPFLRVLRSKNPAQTTALSRAIADLKRAVRPDCVLVYALSPGVFFHLCTRAAYPAPSIVTLHSSVARYAAQTEGMVGQSLADAAWVMACCQNALQDARDRYPFIAAKTSVVHNAVEPRVGSTPELQLAPPRLLHVGRLVPEKGADLAIAALPAILAGAPDTCLRIAGDGPLHQTLMRQAAELGVAERVEILGFVAQPALSHLLADASIVVQPSRSEGISLAALEAAHAGRPVVAARVGGFPELVVDGETGLLVPPESPGALAEAILRLIGDPEGARRMGVNARRRARESFRWNDYVDAYDERLRAVGGAR